MRNIFTDHSPFSAELNNDIQIGGAGVLELIHKVPANDQPQMQKLVLLPGLGMNTYKLETFLPGHGTFQSLDSLDLLKAEKYFAQPDPHGNRSFMSGGAFLVPFGNRIRGSADADKKTVQVNIGKHKVKLPANWSGAHAGAEKHAIHGLIFNKEVTLTEMRADQEKASAKAHLECGDFGVGWPSLTNLDFSFELFATSFRLKIKATNVGAESTPIGIGWHPYFAFPSGDREQVRLKIPARRRTLTNNRDDVFPTGEIADVAGTPYDFSGSAGNSLGKNLFDDCLVDMTKETDQSITLDIMDPKANYYLRIKTKAPPVRNFQFYAPPDKAFVCLEPQTNMPDPFSEIWGVGTDAIGFLEPGQDLDYEVEVEIRSTVK